VLRRPLESALKAQLHFVFIEADERRFEHLKGELAKRKPQPKVEITLVHGDFSDRFPAVLSGFKQRFGEQPPTFAFIDPFGADDTAHELTSGLIKLPRCEALIYVPITHLTRFVTEPDLEPTLVNLYGGRSWEPARRTNNLDSRRQILQDAFRARLRESCQWVRWFEIVPEVGKNSYSLFFGTNSAMGLRRMKDAMWKIDPVRGTSFRDSTTVDHPVLFAQKPDLRRLERLIHARFRKCRVRHRGGGRLHAEGDRFSRQRAPEAHPKGSGGRRACGRHGGEGKPPARPVPGRNPDALRVIHLVMRRQEQDVTASRPMSGHRARGRRPSRDVHPTA
jgi:three-Cys-motif partner protein